MSGEPTAGMEFYQSNRRVLAGEIVEVVKAGCYVLLDDGSAVLRLYVENMTARYTPVSGDYWIVYGDGYEAICPKEPFLDGYTPLNAPRS